MANAAGFIHESIWRDDHWRILSRPAQALYMQLLSQKELDCAGILPLPPNKWAKGCGGVPSAGRLRCVTCHTTYLTHQKGPQRSGRIEATLERAVTTVPGERHRRKVSKGKRHSVYVRDNWTCQKCGRQFTPSDFGRAPHETDHTGKRFPFSNDVWLEIDHIHPLHHGGQADIDNLQALCTPCNRRKSFDIEGAGNA